MSITSGLAPIRNYANGGDVNKGVYTDEQRQDMLARLGFPGGMTDEDLDAAIAESERLDNILTGGGPRKTAEDLKQDVKDYVFDYTDPLEYATLPLIAPKIAMRGKKIYDAVRGSGSNLSQNLRGIGAYIGTDILARDVLGYENPFGDDAQDEAQQDLEEVNKKEEEEKEKKEEEKELTPKEKGIKALGAFAEALGDSQEYTSTPGYMIEGASISTPEIRRYAEGGIAQLADEEVSGYVKGGLVNLGKGIFKKGKDFYKKTTKKEAKEKGVDVDKKKPATKKEEIGVTKDKKTKTQKVKEETIKAVPPELAVPIVATGRLSREALRKLGGEGGVGRGAARAGIYGGLGVAAYDALTGDDKKEPTKGSDTAAVPEIEESDALLDIIRQTSLERAQAAGRTEPSFIDYLASFPSSYMEKVERDPEFARQMMAGFTAMTRTTEGFAPRNALTDFVQGVEAERIRQEDATPDQLKLIEAFAADPQLLESFTKFNRATNPLSGEELADDISVVASLIKESLYGDAATKKPIFKLGSTERGENTPLSDLQIYQLYQSATGTPSERLSAVIGMVERET